MRKYSINASSPNLSITPSYPGIHDMDDSSLAPSAGLLFETRLGTDEWISRDCDESLIGRVEINSKRGLVNFIASEDFALGNFSAQTKRALERAIVSSVQAYNQSACAVAITIHENHLKGDGRIHADANIPREPNPRDYNRYHTLGVSFASNGRMLPHYHLQFEDGRVKADMLRVLLHPLLHASVDGKAVISERDAEAIIAKVPDGRSDAPVTERAFDAHPGTCETPSAIESRDACAVRDNYRSAFIALSTQNTENRAGSSSGIERSLTNMLMNSHREADPSLSCFMHGTTTLSDTLHRIEKGDCFRSSTVADYADANRVLRDALQVAREFPDSLDKEALVERIAAARVTMQEAYRSSPPAGSMREQAVNRER